MTRTIAARIHTAALRAEDGQGTVEYVGLAMAIGVLLLAVGSVLGKDHGIGSIITGAIKSARRVCAVDIPKQIVIVDDGSTDGTRKLLESLEKDPSALLRKYPANRFAFCLFSEEPRKRRGRARGNLRAEEPITLIQDADLEYDPADYARLIDPIVKGRADVVYGSRFAGSDRRILYFWNSSRINC